MRTIQWQRALICGLLLGPVSAFAQEKKPVDPPKKAPVKTEIPAMKRIASVLFPLKRDQITHYSMKVSKIGTDEMSKKTKVRDYTMTIRLGDDEDIGGKKHTVLKYFIDGELRQTEYFTWADGGLECSRRVYGPKEHARPFEIVPAQIILKGTMSKGIEWKWSGKIGKTNGNSGTKVLPDETIKVAGKEYPCVVVEMTFDGKDESKGNSRRWYSPGFGLVKEVIDVKTPTEGFRTEILFQKTELVKKNK
jgi:hypothetical protein